MDAGRTRTFTTEAEELEGTLCRTAAEFVQVVIPQSLRDRVPGLSYYAKLAGHPGGRKLYKTLRRQFYWPSMALDCYAVANNCAACARERVKLRRNTKQMKLFTPEAPLEFVVQLCTTAILGRCEPNGRPGATVASGEYTRPPRSTVVPPEVHVVQLVACIVATVTRVGSEW